MGAGVGTGVVGAGIAGAGVVVTIAIVSAFGCAGSVNVWTGAYTGRVTCVSARTGDDAGTGGVNNVGAVVVDETANTDENRDSADRNSYNSHSVFKTATSSDNSTRCSIGELERMRSACAAVDVTTTALPTLRN